MFEGAAPVGFAEWIIGLSALLFCGCYVWLSRREGSYINLLTPSFIVHFPAYYVLPMIYMLYFARIHGSEYSSYAYTYVYGTLALKSIAFVAAYLWTRRRLIRLPFALAYRNFYRAAMVCLVLAVAIYLPVLIEFREFIFDPRKIYIRTRTGYGLLTYNSTFLALFAVVFILFARCRVLAKSIVIIAATVLLLLHGSKGQTLGVFFLLLLFQVYVRERTFSLPRALAASAAVALVVFVLFATTMNLTSGLQGALEGISAYADYARNAMLVVDSHVPVQYGRLTFERNVYSIIPRAVMPSKPKDFGAFYLAKKFYPTWFYGDTGAPDFGIGVEYADFGPFAVVYVVLFSALEGWLARIFVNRLMVTRHPADFVLVAFLAGVSVIPVGGAGWLFPEMVLVALFLRYISRIGARPGQRGPADVAGMQGSPVRFDCSIGRA
jgi:hypothetical protein